MILRVAVLLAMWPAVASAQTTRDSAGVRIVITTPAMATPVIVSKQPLRVIAFDRDAEVVGALQLSDGSIWIGEGSTRALWKVTPAGVRNTVGTWSSLSGLFRAGSDSLFVWDGVARKATLLDRTGRPRGSQNVRPPRDIIRSNGTSGRPWLQLLGRMGDGSLFGALRDPYRDGRANHVDVDSMKLVRVGRDGALLPVTTLLREQRVLYRGTRSGMQAPLPFGQNGSIAVLNDGFLYSDGAAFRIEERGGDGAVRRVVRLERPLPVVMPAEIARFKAARLAALPLDQRAEYAAGLDWLPWPARKGGWTALHRDATGRLWARQWASDDEDATWDLFAPDGRHLGTTTVPAGVRVLDIGHDYLIGVVAGERGVEVRVYGTAWGGR